MDLDQSSRRFEKPSSANCSVACVSMRTPSSHVSSIIIFEKRMSFSDNIDIFLFTSVEREENLSNDKCFVSNLKDKTEA